MRRLVIALTTGVLATTALTAGTGQAGTTTTMRWTPCADAPGVECGTLAVPLSWSAPHGAKITLSVARRPANDPAHRVGTLFFNPGGPGDPSTDYIKSAELIFSATLRSRFDIVAMDPRGVGASTPVVCTSPMLAADVTLFPRTRAAFERLRQFNAEAGKGCLDGAGALVGHVDTVSAARDHEALRLAMGENQITWFGISYGTQLASNYAALYPKATRAMVLDAALEHSGSESAMLAEEIRTVEDSFNRFAAWCATDDTCALKGQDVARVYDDLVARADRNPIPAPGALRPVTGEDIRMRTPHFLVLKEPSIYGPDTSWAGLSRAIKRAVEGDASAFAQPPAESAGGIGQLLSIACGDYVSEIKTWADMRQRIQLGRQLAPHLQGATEQWQVLRCIDWPVPAANPFRRLDVRGVPALIVNATHDPSTSYAWAHGLLGQIEGSALLTRVGDGHTSYYTSPCARAATDAYLVRPQAPADRICT